MLHTLFCFVYLQTISLRLRICMTSPLYDTTLQHDLIQILTSDVSYIGLRVNAAYNMHLFCRIGGAFVSPAFSRFTEPAWRDSDGPSNASDVRRDVKHDA